MPLCAFRHIVQRFPKGQDAFLREMCRARIVVDAFSFKPTSVDRTRVFLSDSLFYRFSGTRHKKADRKKLRAFIFWSATPACTAAPPSTAKIAGVRGTRHSPPEDNPPSQSMSWIRYPLAAF
jgi:hypothetical protein